MKYIDGSLSQEKRSKYMSVIGNITTASQGLNIIQYFLPTNENKSWKELLFLLAAATCI